MRLGHRKLPANILDGKLVLDIGCGRKKLPGSVGLDHMPLPGVDVVASLEQPLPFEDEEFDAVYANQVLEHVRDMVGLMSEIHRILRPGGIFLAHVPYFRSSWAHIDPTHVRSFTVNTMDFFVKGTYCHEGYRFSDRAFASCEVVLDQDYPSTLMRHLLTPMAVAKPFRYENNLLSSIYPFEQVSYVLTK